MALADDIFDLMTGVIITDEANRKIAIQAAIDADTYIATTSETIFQIFYPLPDPNFVPKGYRSQQNTIYEGMFRVYAPQVEVLLMTALHATAATSGDEVIALAPSVQPYRRQLWSITATFVMTEPFSGDTRTQVIEYKIKWTLADPHDSITIVGVPVVTSDVNPNAVAFGYDSTVLAATGFMCALGEIGKDCTAECDYVVTSINI